MFLIVFIMNEISLATGYVIGSIVALFIIGYLVYSLAKPENF
jgi:hypothetical protein